jgi:hypothetical protein
MLKPRVASKEDEGNVILLTSKKMIEELMNLMIYVLSLSLSLTSSHLLPLELANILSLIKITWSWFHLYSTCTKWYQRP